MRNVQIKAKIADIERICSISEKLSNGPPAVIKQDDTFYRANFGRLKMRFYADSSATLVRYDREDQGGPKLSDLFNRMALLAGRSRGTSSAAWLLHLASPGVTCRALQIDTYGRVQRDHHTSGYLRCAGFLTMFSFTVKLSDYELLHFSNNEVDKAKLLDEMLKKCLGVRGRVVKERKLYMVGQTRVHIDTVEGLGHYMELEVVLRPEQTVAEGQEIALGLQKLLEVADSDLIECAYVDLLDQKQSVKNNV